MKVAFGLKAHSGWAALVVLGTEGKEFEVVDRRRLELIEEGEEWAKQPYHAAEGLSSVEARRVVKRGVDSARRIALRQMRALTRGARENGHELAGCGLLVGQEMPDWSVDEILAVHFRMHKAEGVLFREVLGRAARECELRLVEIPEKLLFERAEAVLETSLTRLLKKVSILGKSVGPPWGKDQKDATLAAMIALQEFQPTGSLHPTA